MYESTSSSLSNFLGVELENDIALITLEDGLTHTYCSKISWEKDNMTPIGGAKIIMPYDEKIESYWVNYKGPVVVHANLNSNKKSNPASIPSDATKISLNLKKVRGVDFEPDEKTKKIRFKNDEYNYSYIGKVSRFKQIGKTFVIFLEDLGWKFMQKVPKTFRDTYISGQRLDEAFQAICEFMGIDFAYSIEDLAQYNFGADGYSVEKDGKVVETTPSILREWGPSSDEEEDELTEDEKIAERLDLPDGVETDNEMYNQARNQSNKQSANQSNESLNNSVTNSNNSDDTEMPEEEEEEEQETDTVSVDEKIEMYQEEFDEKIKDLFIGNTYYDSNLTDAILNYNWISIQPKAQTAEATGTTGGATTGSASGSEEGDKSSGGSSGFKWTQMSRIVAKYFNRNNPNKNTIIKAFRNCSNNWTCIANTYDKYKKYCSAKSKNTVIREIMSCFG